MTNDIDAQANALLAELTPTSPSAAPGQNMLPPNTRRDVNGKHGATPLWRAHDGAATLFVHGWDDTHRIWRQFAQDFLVNSRPLLLMDLPGHGASKVDGFTIDYAGQAVLDVCQAEAPIDAVIAHSYGCAATSWAIANGAKPDYVILIAPPVLGWAESKRRAGTDPAVIDRVLDIVQGLGGGEMGPFDFENALKAYEGKLLLIGSQADIGCPAQDISELAARLAGAQMVTLSEPDHRELCLDPRVLGEILRFLEYA